LPIVAIVLILSLTIAPIPSNILVAFLIGGLLLVLGMMLFNLGAELAMEPMGSVLGARLTRTHRLIPIVLSCFILGVIITVSEPDLQVLASQVQSIPKTSLIMSVAAGVGIFLVIAILRMLFCWQLRGMLLLFYGVAFALACFAPGEFLAMAFDSGGVTTGPMTVPFIMAFGVGISSVRNDRNAADDSFGLVALCSIGPILSVLLLSLIFRPENGEYALTLFPSVEASTELGKLFLVSIPEYLGEIALCLLPILVFFGFFQVILLKLDRRKLMTLLVGLLYTYTGLVLFMTGVNVGFMPAGSYLGQILAGLSVRWILIPIGMLIGYFMIKAEPAVYVLMRQVEELTDGRISGAVLQKSLSIGTALSAGIAMLRVLTGIPIMWFIVPGYVISLVLTLVVPRIFTAIAFDSGGVASGPMTATFLLPFAAGACSAIGGNVVTDAFGVVAMVAMTPLITIQILGVIFKFRKDGTASAEDLVDQFAEYDERTVIEL